MGTEHSSGYAVAKQHQKEMTEAGDSLKKITLKVYYQTCFLLHRISPGVLVHVRFKPETINRNPGHAKKKSTCVAVHIIHMYCMCRVDRCAG